LCFLSNPFGNYSHPLQNEMNSFAYEYKFSYRLKHASYSVQSLPSCAFPETTLDPGELVLLGINKNKNTSTKSKLLLASILSEEGIAKLREKPQKGKTGFYTCESLSDMIRKRRSVSSKWQIFNMKFMPQNPLQVACRNERSEILFYDLTKASDDTNLMEKNIWTLKGLGSCGYGLSWNASLPGMLVAAGHDNTICIWSVLHSIVNSDTIHPLSTFRIRRGAINDVCWHPFYDFVFGTVDNSGKLLIWDVRMNGDGEFALQSNTTNSEIMCLSFNPFDQNYLATGDIKGNVAIWDDRNLYRPVKLLQYHSSEVTQVAWSPSYEDLLASAGSDGHIILWKIGNWMKSHSETDDLPIEVEFIHKCSKAVTGISWSASSPLRMLSVSEDASFEIIRVPLHCISFLICYINMLISSVTCIYLRYTVSKMLVQLEYYIEFASK
ncbi:Histone-binding protein RBBP4, partial [Trichinella zimbabwensis]